MATTPNICDLQNSVSEENEGPMEKMPLSAHGESVRAIRDAFFGKESIVHTMNFLFSRYVTSMKDIIVTLPSLLLNESIDVCFTETGYVPIKKDPTLIIPYTQMTKKQLGLIKAVCTGMRESKEYNGCTQMGGGIFIYDNFERERFFVEPKYILYACHVNIRFGKDKAKQSGKIQKKEIANIILQRLFCNNLITHQQIIDANKMTSEWIKLQGLQQPDA